MGQNQLKPYPANPKNQQEMDFESDIFESQSGSYKQRQIEALRISESDRGFEENQITSSNVQETSISEETLKIATGAFKISFEEQRILQGTLLKLSPKSLFAQWTQRYCYLTNNKFIYLEGNAPTSSKAGTLNFDLLSCFVIANQKNDKIDSFTIKAKDCDKEFIFSAQHKDDNIKWVKAIDEITKKSFGFQYNLTYLSHYHRFWRKDYFSEKQFRDKAETGDIILMRGSKQAAIMQRAITQEQFDHVALIIKNVKGQVLLFEANGAVGVGIMPWHRFISKEYYKNQQMYIQAYEELFIENCMLKEMNNSFNKFKSLSKEIWEENINFQQKSIS